MKVPLPDWWTLLTFVPGTPPHRLHKKVAAWLRETSAGLLLIDPNFPPFPLKRMPRSRGAMYAAVDAMHNVLNATMAAMDGKPELMEEFLGPGLHGQSPRA